jgi:hypothetical protein
MFELMLVCYIENSDQLSKAKQDFMLNTFHDKSDD